MFGFNWVDLVILLIIVYAAYIGTRLGFVTLLATFGGFFVALFSAGWLFPRILPIHDKTLLAVVNTNVVLAAATVLAIVGFRYGRKMHLSLGKGKLHIIESLAGISLSVASVLIIVWIVAAGIGAMPIAGFSNNTNSSQIVQALNRLMPAAPTVLDEFAPLVNPNASISIYDKFAPNSSIGVAPMPPAIPKPVIAASGSVVRITSFGCGGIVDGSGFVYAKNLVATNAHVVAGVNNSIVKLGRFSYNAATVLFDPNQDVAVLKVPALNALPLALNPLLLADKTSLYGISFPLSIFTFSPGEILSNNPTTSSNIYGIGSITRSTYALSMTIKPGSSGGPIIDSSGKVAGMLFARSKSQPIAYALSINAIEADLTRVNSTSAQVGTGTCYE